MFGARQIGSIRFEGGVGLSVGWVAGLHHPIGNWLNLVPTLKAGSPDQRESASQMNQAPAKRSAQSIRA